MYMRQAIEFRPLRIQRNFKPQKHCITHFFVVFSDLPFKMHASFSTIYLIVYFRTVKGLKSMEYGILSARSMKFALISIDLIIHSLQTRKYWLF